MRELFHEERFGYTYNERIPPKFQLWDINEIMPPMEPMNFRVYTAFMPNCQWSLFQ